MDFERFLQLLKALAREGVDYVIVGAVALSLHGIVKSGIRAD
jgi:diphthamide synthase (EF-2-diphthine--ammonia ligase)